MSYLHKILKKKWYSPKYEKDFWMQYEMTVVSKIIITFPCLMRGKGGPSCGHMHCRITTQNHSFAMLDALMYFIIRHPMFTQLHIIFTLKISLPSFWHTIKHLQHERLYDKLNLDLINFTRRQARLVVPDKGSHYDAKWIFYFPKLSSE